MESHPPLPPEDAAKRQRLQTPDTDQDGWVDGGTSSREKKQIAESLANIKLDEMKMGEDEILAQELQEEEFSNKDEQRQMSCGLSGFEGFDVCGEYDDESYALRLQEEESIRQKIRREDDERSARLARELQEEELAIAGKMYESSVSTSTPASKTSETTCAIAATTESDESCARVLQQARIQEKMRVEEEAQKMDDEDFALKLQEEELAQMYQTMAKGDKKVKAQDRIRATVPGAVSVEKPTPLSLSTSVASPDRLGHLLDRPPHQARNEGENVEDAEQENVAVDVRSAGASLSSRTTSSLPAEDSPPLLEAWVARDPDLVIATPMPEPESESEREARLARLNAERDASDHREQEVQERRRLYSLFLIMTIPVVVVIGGFALLLQKKKEPPRQVNESLITLLWEMEEFTVVVQLNQKPEETGWSLDCGAGPSNVIA